MLSDYGPPWQLKMTYMTNWKSEKGKNYPSSLCEALLPHEATFFSPLFLNSRTLILETKKRKPGT